MIAAYTEMSADPFSVIQPTRPAAFPTRPDPNRWSQAKYWPDQNKTIKHVYFWKPKQFLKHTKYIYWIYDPTRQGIILTWPAGRPVSWTSLVQVPSEGQHSAAAWRYSSSTLSKELGEILQWQRRKRCSGYEYKCY